jgi:hypothetical protein
MDTTTAKDELLRSAGYWYNFYRMAYVNRKSKKIFSVEAVEDHTEEQLRQMITAPNESGDWLFYFGVSGETPPPAVRQAFIAELDGRSAHR